MNSSTSPPAEIPMAPAGNGPADMPALAEPPPAGVQEGGLAEAKPESHMAEAMGWGHTLTQYAIRYGALTGVVLVGVVIAGVIIRKIIKKK